MTYAQFAEVFAILAMQLRAGDTTDVTIQAYYKILRDVNLELVKLAAEYIARNEQYFPKTSEWLDRTRRLYFERHEQQRELIQRLHRQGKELCESCSDTGWRREQGTSSVKPCECVNIRRDELLGRRALPERVM